jgi:hypothetical protein
LSDEVVTAVRAKSLTLGRLAVTAFTIVTWFVVSNHCALGAIQRSGTVSDVHAHCPGHPAPAKQHRDRDMPCCKTLKAITAAKINTGANAVDFVLKNYFSGQFASQILQAHTHILGLDTGPPDALSFSESVLQQSILAHAPPVSLS